MSSNSSNSGNSGNGSCNECSHSLTYLHSKGIVTDELFNKIIAGHKNKDFYNLVNQLKPTRNLYKSLSYIPKYITDSFTDIF